MVIGLGRCGTTWAANWLTEGRALCHHDPLRLSPIEEWDERLTLRGRLTGVACTGAWNWPDLVNAHPARKVILHRNAAEVAASFRRLCLPGPPVYAAERLHEIDGLHVAWRDLFNVLSAGEIWRYLMGGALPFDVERHAVLREVNAQPQFDRLRSDPAAVRNLVTRLRVEAREA